MPHIWKWRRLQLDELAPLLSNAAFRVYCDSSVIVWQNKVNHHYRITVNSSVSDVLVDDLETLEEVIEYLEN